MVMGRLVVGRLVVSGVVERVARTVVLRNAYIPVFVPFETGQSRVCPLFYAAQQKSASQIRGNHRANNHSSFHMPTHTRPVLLLKNPSTPSDPYHDRFSASEFHPVFIPLLHHSHWDKQQTIDFLTSDDFLATPTFIITSKRGVEMFDECVQAIDDPSVKKAILAKTAYTVGPATYDELRRIGFANVRGGNDAGNGLKLAHLIHHELGDGPHRMVFFTGEIRKDILPVTLKLFGYDLRERVIYKTENRHDIVDQFETAWREHSHADPWVVFFLPQGTESIVARVREVGGVKIAVIGPTTEEYLVDNQLTPHVVADKPTAAALVAAITAFGDRT